MLVKIAKVVAFILVAIIAGKAMGQGVQFILQGLMCIAFWGTWFTGEGAGSKAWNYCGLVLIVAGLGKFM